MAKKVGVPLHVQGRGKLSSQDRRAWAQPGGRSCLSSCRIKAFVYSLYRQTSFMFSTLCTVSATCSGTFLNIPELALQQLVFSHKLSAFSLQPSSTNTSDTSDTYNLEILLGYQPNQVWSAIDTPFRLIHSLTRGRTTNASCQTVPPSRYYRTYLLV